MGGRPFFDTNILIYTVAKEDPRAEVARALLAEGGVVSVHVLNEFVAAARRKYRMSWPETLEALADFRILCPDPVPLSVKTHETALQVAERYGYHIYDALVIAAAIETSCSVLYSEDMQSGQRIGNLKIRNPF